MPGSERGLLRAAHDKRPITRVPSSGGGRFLIMSKRNGPSLARGVGAASPSLDQTPVRRRPSSVFPDRFGFPTDMGYIDQAGSGSATFSPRRLPSEWICGSFSCTDKGLRVIRILLNEARTSRSPGPPGCRNRGLPPVKSGAEGLFPGEERTDHVLGRDGPPRRVATSNTDFVNQRR